MGVDGISLPFVLLTTFLMPLCILASWVAISTRVKEYMIAFLVLETLMIGVFTSLDLVMFYLFFEGGLIPMFLIIGVWGGQRRVYASFKFFLYTLAGSLLMLLAIMAIYWEAGTTDIPVLLTHGFPPEMQTWLWFAFLASFAVKLPMWPVHTWLPDAHVEAPTAGSVILAGILLKMGGYGFLRFSIPMFPLASAEFAPLIFALSVVAIIYTSLVALAQEDVKKLIAYSSVAHMGFVTIGVFTLTMQGLQGGIFQMLSHGIVSAALFLCVGVIYDRMHTREISAFGGLADRMPIYAFCFMVFTLANVGLPGTSGFIGEFLSLTGAFRINTWVAFLATTGVILSAAYALYLYRRIIFGKLEKASLKFITDLTWREVAVMTPLVVLTILFGFYPGAHPRCVGRLGRRADQELPRKPRRRRAGAARADAVRSFERAPIAQPRRRAAGADPVSRRHGAADARRIHAARAGRAHSVARGTPPRRGGPFRGDLLRHRDAVRRQLHRRSLRPDAEAVDADRRRRSADHVARLLARAGRGEIRVRGAGAARHHRHDDDDLGQRSHRALCRARVAEPRALRGRRLQPQLRRARPKRGSNISSSARCPRACCFTAHRSFTASPARPTSPSSPRRCSLRAPISGSIFGLVFLMAGFAFKISAVPFHMWTPDVYEGAPTPVTAFFAAAPKLAAMALTVRVLITAFPAVTLQWQQIVVFLAIASMALGSFAAIGQTNIKRLMAYSSIGHMGYALVGLAAGSAEGVAGVIIYLAIYLAMTLGTFACILAMRRDGRMIEDIDALAGLSRTQPMMAFLLAMLLFSLAGIPPLAGFFAKFYVFLGRHSCRPLRARRHRRAFERGGRLLLSSHRQAYVFRCSRGTLRADAGAACRCAWRQRSVHPALFRLSGAAGRVCRSCSQVTVLNDIFFIAIAENAERLPPASDGDGGFDQCRGEAPRQGWRARSALDLVRPAIAGPWPRRPRMDLPARQSVCEPADRHQLPASAWRASWRWSPASSPSTPSPS